ncbi:phosphatase [Cupriavidus sp. TA19]|uniref:HAD family hydrolase n=1 Tax=unclassified Cupriavidus TaxID=2640874 RepID=UPI000E2E92D1|nr:MULTISPECIES: HAD family hydrolase [unclassified Cupriavidus]BDB27547.1 HAD family hydrolase [Cupriavidus sp. P-10]GLC96338.1 phosphatase [Cupriavidus sp. TA19]
MKALIFDVDGTLADTETAHLQAFNSAFAEVGLDWCWDEALYTRLLRVAGGKERLMHYWRMVDPEEAQGCKVKETIDAVHAIKTRHYAERVGSGQLPLRPGIARLIEEAGNAGVPIAIATTTTPANLDALLQVPLGQRWRERFAAIGDAGTTAIKKPAPDVYLAVLEQLGLEGGDCLAIEDSENGLRAAQAAGIATVITPTAYTAQDRFDGALLVLPHLGDPAQPLPRQLPGAAQRWADLGALRNWHRGTRCEAA